MLTPPDIRIKGQNADPREARPSYMKEVELGLFIEQCRIPIQRDIVAYLGKRALDPHDEGAEIDDIITVVSAAKRKRGELQDDLLSDSYITQGVSALRKALKLYAENQKSRPYHIILPNATKTDRCYKVIYKATNAGDPAVMLWKKMIFSHQSRNVALLYDTPSIYSLKSELKIPGQFAGSGDVAAAAFIGQILARIRPRFEVNPHRYCDLGEPSFDGLHDVCQIILGASSSEYFVRTIKNHPTMRGRQVFHFGEADDKDRRLAQEFCLTKEPTFDCRSITKTEMLVQGDLSNRVEHAIISFFRCNDRTIVALQGTSSVSTLGATVLMCDHRAPAILKRLFEELGYKKTDDKLPSFELQVEVGVGRNARMEYVDVVELIPHKDSR